MKTETVLLVLVVAGAGIGAYMLLKPKDEVKTTPISQPVPPATSSDGIGFDTLNDFGQLIGGFF